MFLTEDSSLLGCYAMLIDSYPRATIFRVKQSKTLLGLLDPEDEDPTILKRSVTIHQSTSRDITEYEFSVT
jgi:hypothetical protein